MGENHWTGLQGSDWFLVVVSPQAITSEWVRSEVDWALENLSTRVVPLLIGGADAGEIHLRLRLVQSVDWTSSSADAKIQLLYAGVFHPLKNQICESAPSQDLKFDGYLFGRPKNWHCIFCGWKCQERVNDYICKQCKQIRPFAGGQATMIKCRVCGGFSLALAHYCEWCGGDVST